MKLLSMVTTRIQRVVLATVLAGTALVPMAGFFNTATVNAQVGGGSGPTIYSVVNGPATTSLDTSSGVSFTMHNAFDSQESMYVQGSLNGGFSTGQVTSVSASITKDGLDVSCQVEGHTGNFVSGDYATPATNVVLKTSSANCGFTYPVTFVSGTEYRLNIDISPTGQVDFYWKEGAGTDTVLTSFIYSGTQISKALTIQASSYQSHTDCTGMTATDTDVVSLINGANATSVVLKDAGPCSNFDKSTYDSGTKIANVKFLAGNTPGVEVKHYFTNTTTSTDKSSQFATYTSLDYYPIDGTSVKNVQFKDYVTPTSSNAVQMYLTASSDGTDGFKKDDYHPVASGVFDLSGANIDLKTVTMLANATKYTSYAHGLGALTKDGSFNLYVPFREGDKYVGVCAGATSIDATTNKCNGLYYVKDGQTKTSKDTKSITAGHSVKASQTTVAGVKYWLVEGLTGTGAFSANIASDPDTGISVSATSTPIAVAVMITALGAALYARRSLSKK